MSSRPGPDPALLTVTALGMYNLVQNLMMPDRAYVPANLAASVALVAHARRSGATLDDLGLAPTHLQRGVETGAVAAAIAAAGVAVANRVPGARTWLRDERARYHDRTQAAGRVLIRFPLGTALFEEVAFRGVLYGLWRRRSGTVAARRLTAAAFGAWHLVPTFQLWPQMAFGADQPTTSARLRAAVAGALATTISSIGFTWMRERSGSVAAPWLAHAAINSLSYLAARSYWRHAAAGCEVTGA